MNFVLSVVALVLAPFVYAFGRRQPLARQMLDGFIFITIASIVCVGIIPEAIKLGGTPAFGFLVAGLAFPFLIEHLGAISHRSAHVFVAVLAAVGLALHAAIDGLALLDEQLAMPVILHRLPIGMAIWWSVRPNFGTPAALLVFALLIAATAAAYFLGTPVADIAEARSMAWFQAFVAGSLVHIVAFGVSHEHDEQIEPAAQFRDWGYRAGILIGLFVAISG